MLILTRHSKTAYNLQGVMQGSRLDPNVIEGDELRNYVDKLSPQIKDIKIASIICSPMKRALSSLKAIVNIDEYDVQIIKDFKEIDIGNFSGKKSDTLPTEVQRLRSQNKLTFKWPNGESMKNVVTRLLPYKEIMTTASNSSSNLLIMSHETVTRCILYLLSMEAKYLDLKISNTDMLKYEGDLLLKNGKLLSL